MIMANPSKKRFRLTSGTADIQVKNGHGINQEIVGAMPYGYLCPSGYSHLHRKSIRALEEVILYAFLTDHPALSPLCALVIMNSFNSSIGAFTDPYSTALATMECF
jgi:hypothetical protein